MSAVSRAWEIAKAHPWAVGGSVVGLILLIMFFSRDKSAPAQGVPLAYGADPQLLAYNAQIQISHDTLQAHGLDTAAAIAINQSNNAAAVTAAQLQSETIGHYVDVIGATTGHQADLQASTMANYFDTSKTIALNNNETELAAISSTNELAKFLATSQERIANQQMQTQRFNFSDALQGMIYVSGFPGANPAFFNAPAISANINPLPGK